MKPAFSFQVTSKGVIINLNPDYDLSGLKEALSRHVEEANDFFAGVDLYLNFEGFNIEYGDLQEIMEIVSGYSEVNNIYFASKKKSREKTQKKDTVLVRGTIRSGQRIKYPSNIVIVGDVNPGAEVIAAGDIIVLGRLRGVVHAGASGSTGAQVIAFRLQPTQLRIANIISRPPDTEHKETIVPEKAFINDSKIIVEDLAI
ncbi:MAG: septum site-determining protein MinC [Bacillota bacterium]